jgi:hypothetical protein
MAVQASESATGIRLTRPSSDRYVSQLRVTGAPSRIVRRPRATALRVQLPTGSRQLRRQHRARRADLIGTVDALNRL